MPSSASYTYVANLNFTNLQSDRFHLYDWQAIYDDPRTNTGYRFDNIFAKPLSLSFGISDIKEFASGVSEDIKDFPVVQDIINIAQSGVGYLNIKDSSLKGVANALTSTADKAKELVDDIVDHTLNEAQDLISAPAKLMEDVYGMMKDAWDAGERNLQALLREGREVINSLVVTVGEIADKFGDVVDNAVEMASEIFRAALEEGGKQASALTAKGEAIFDKYVDAASRLPSQGAGLFAKLTPDIFSKVSNIARTLLIAAIIGIAVIAAVVIFTRMN